MPMKRALLALALSLSASFLLSSCGDNAAKERARIEGEIELVRDSVRVCDSLIGVTYNKFLMDGFAEQKRNGKEISLYHLMKNKSSNPVRDSLISVNEIYRSRLDSLNRKLQELPDK